MAETKFEQWAIVELMGHVRMAGFVREVQIAGAGMLSVEVPEAVDDGGSTHAAYTQIVNPTSLYRITPTTEEIARSVARHSRPAAINQWELPKPALPAPPDVSQEEVADEIRTKHEPDEDYGGDAILHIDLSVTPRIEARQ